jgi:hypothetical protein
MTTKRSALEILNLLAEVREQIRVLEARLSGVNTIISSYEHRIRALEHAPREVHYHNPNFPGAVYTPTYQPIPQPSTPSYPPISIPTVWCVTPATGVPVE